MSYNLIGNIVKVSDSDIEYRCFYGRVVNEDLDMPGSSVAVLFPGFIAPRWFYHRQCRVVKGVELLEYFKAMLKYGR